MLIVIGIMKLKILLAAIPIMLIENFSAIKRIPGGPNKNHTKNPDKKSISTVIKIFDLLLMWV